MKIWRYVKTRGLIILVLSLVCGICINISAHYNAVKSEDKIMYAIFKDKFTEPIEVMYFLMDDMKLLKITSHDEIRIEFKIWELKKDFERNGYEISNIIVIIHNHMKCAYFSDDDINTYRTFKGEGFKGKFYIYVHRNKGIYELAEYLR